MKVPALIKTENYGDLVICFFLDPSLKCSNGNIRHHFTNAEFPNASPFFRIIPFFPHGGGGDSPPYPPHPNYSPSHYHHHCAVLHFSSAF